MNCRDGQNLIQRFFDGESTLDSPELRGHLELCADCRQDVASARLLKSGLGQLPKPAPRPVTARLVAAVLQDRETRRRRSAYRWYATAGLAASILLLAGLGSVSSLFKKSPAPTPMVKQPTAELEPVQLTQRADDAQKAVASLTRSVAETTKNQFEVLLAAAPSVEVPAGLALPEFDEPLDPATQSLRQAGITMAMSIEPVTKSARQAFAYFTRDLPVFDPTRRN